MCGQSSLYLDDRLTIKDVQTNFFDIYTTKGRGGEPRPYHDEGARPDWSRVFPFRASSLTRARCKGWAVDDSHSVKLLTT